MTHPLLALLLVTAQVAPEPTPTPAAAELELELHTETPGAGGDERDARAQTVSRVTVADRVHLAGHIERVDGEDLYVVGRRVQTGIARMVGGGRPQLIDGALVQAIGTGSADGSIIADELHVLPGRDPAAWSKLNPELVEFKEKYWKEAKRYDDEELDAYIASIVERLLPDYVQDPERRFRVTVVENPELNAFALPDGDIVMHTGIIARMQNEAQLASVLGHEMAHVTQRHTLRSMTKEKEHKLIGWGSLLAAVALGATGNAEAARGVQLMSSAWLSGYSRGHEDEADQVGLRYLYLAGYDVSEASDVWRTFHLLYGPQSREANFFYGTHSTARDREHSLSAEVWKAYEPSGLLGGEVGTARFLRATAGLVRDNAMLDIERRNHEWARWGLMKSLAIDPDDADTHIALGRLALSAGGRGAYEEAADSLQHAVELAPDNATAHRELGRVLERLGQSDRARTALERYLELSPEAEDAEEVKALLARI